MKRAAIIAAAVMAVLVLAYFWHSSSVESAAEIAKLKASLDSIKADVADRGKKLTGDNRAIDGQVAQAKTPDDLAKLIALFAGVKQPLVIYPQTPPAPTPAPAPTKPPAVGSAPNKSLPDHPQPQPAPPVIKPGSMIVPPEAVEPMANALAEGKKCANSLGVCEKDRDDYKKGMNEAKAVAQGGTRWQRFKRKATIVGIVTGGIGLGFLAGKAASK